MAGEREGVESLRSSLQDTPPSMGKPQRFHYLSSFGRVIHVLDFSRNLKPTLAKKGEEEIIPVDAKKVPDAKPKNT